MKNKKSEKGNSLKNYTEEELKIVEEHIEKYFGEYDSVFRGRDSSRVDVCIIKPSVSRNYYTLVTIGMGSFKMNVPEKFRQYDFERAELAIFLPPDWDYDSDEKDNFWAVTILRLLSQLPERKNSWLGFGHTVNYGDPFLKDSEFSAVALFNPPYDKECQKCTLPDNTSVNFYQVLPICKNELEFKSKHSTEEFIQLFGGKLPFVAETDREAADTENFVRIIDNVEKHRRKIEEKELDVSEINAASHIAAFLLWSIENNLIDEEFTDYFSEEIADIKSGNLDIRKFLINSLDGELTEDIFTEESRDFISFYYNFHSEFEKINYPADVDRSAMEYFGEEKYECDEFKDEAYLFMPFDDEYIKRMNKYIEKGFEFHKSFKKFKYLRNTPDEE